MSYHIPRSTGRASSRLRSAYSQLVFFAVFAGVCMVVASVARAETVRETVHRAHHTAVKRHVSARKARRTTQSTRRSQAEAQEVARLHTPLEESSALRPLAVKLIQSRTPSAYANVTTWASRHHGAAASLAYLALGHAYLMDGHDRHAIAALQKAAEHGSELPDFIAYFLAQAQMGAHLDNEAALTLRHFRTRYPGSILAPFAPVLRANAFLDAKKPRSALIVLRESASRRIGNRADYFLAYAKAEMALGNRREALLYYRRAFTEYPLSSAAAAARKKISSMDLLHTLPVADLRIHADAMYRSGHYRKAKVEYLFLARNRRLSAIARNTYYVAAAACDLKLNRLTQRDINGIRLRNNESGARLLYLNMELARNQGKDTLIRHLIDKMERRFPHSPWLARALYSAGNMYLLKPDYPEAIAYYSELAHRFPYMCERREHRGVCSDLSAKSHWRAAWLTYRLGHYDAAARMFDKEIERYPNTVQFSTALYWRGRIFEREHKPAMAAAYYRTETRLYPHYYYSLLARERLRKMGSVRPAAVPALDRINPQLIPDLSSEIPHNDPRVLKARLLANAGLASYVASQIRTAPGSRRWGAFAEAKIFASGDEAWRAMFALMRVLPFYAQAPFGAIPPPYWKILYPTPYWPQIQTYSKARGLNPYMVASLIRQESGFRPDAISYSNAYGLMQLLPSVGRKMARKAGMRYFRTRDLLNPEINIKLGTLYLKQLMDEFHGNAEYAFAAYNAGDNRVTAWQKIGGYHDMAEFIESIPFTQTHEYVESIIRNEHMYRSIENLSAQVAGTETSGARPVRK